MKKLILSIITTIVCSASLSFAADNTFPDAVFDRIDELKKLVDQKKEMPTTFDGIVSVTTTEAVAAWKGKKVIFLDTRPKAQYDAEKIPGAILLDSDKLLDDPTLANNLDKSKEYITYCSGVLCRRAPGAAVELKGLGFTNVRYYRGGLPEWKASGNPVQ